MKREEIKNSIYKMILENDDKFYKKINTKAYQKFIHEPYKIGAGGWLYIDLYYSYTELENMLNSKNGEEKVISLLEIFYSYCDYIKKYNVNPKWYYTCCLFKLGDEKLTEPVKKFFLGKYLLHFPNGGIGLIDEIGYEIKGKEHIEWEIKHNF